MRPRLPHLRNVLLAATALLALSAARVAAEPQGGVVVGGAATIQGQGTPSVIINQSSSSAIINWNTFNIRANESVRFNQPSSSSVALNRVTGGLGPSEIMGTLTANGRVFLINRDGILFGPGSVVNTAGFLASTHDIRNSDFMAGRYNFNIPGRPDASIVNQGRITATNGGFAALVAPGVRNSGTITATLGTVALAAGNSFTLDMYGDKLITLAVNDQIAAKVIDVATGKPLKSLVTNDGKVRANGGRVELSAAAARTVVDSVINTTGVIKANSIGRRNGMIVLSAATGASKPAGAPAQTINISGKLSAAGRRKGTKGGTIVVSGEHIKLAAARIDASGRRGGGKVLIGGDWGGGRPDQSLVKNRSAALEAFAIPTATTVSVDAATTIDASATRRGNGGKVILWSDSETTFAGTILARGGTQAGDGGFVETSSHGQLAFAGNVDSGAPRGKAGTLLLDPQDFFIRLTCEGPSCGPNETTANQIQTWLLSQNVVIATNNSLQFNDNGDIFVQASINWSTNNSLTLSAFHDINISSNATITNTGAGNLILRADSTGIGSGTLILNAGTFANRIDYSQSTGTVSVFYNPANYTSPTDYLTPTNPHVALNPAMNNQFTAYMLVNTATDLNNVRTNTSGTYALGRDINAASIANFAPIPNFTGLFEGQNLTIANLTIAPSDGTTNNIGLFGTIGSSGIVRNLNLSNVSVTANPGVASQWVSTLAGINTGTVINVSATGKVDGLALAGVVAGGLVGENDGLIQSSSSAAAVSLGSSSSSALLNVAGGLAGTNRGTIADSSATGNVMSGAFSLAGGLVGENMGEIARSFASGAVAVGSYSWAGGLVGSNGQASFNIASIEDSYATGAVSSAGINVGLGGLAGFNAPGSTIVASFATGDVTSTAAVPAQSAADCSAGNSCQFAAAGGLVGQNFGTIAGASTPALNEPC
ncbi:MAG: filamentous hemagglutinin N-terminal domain-containing protein, partial [Xanthobacteraceae bacterium]